jgi:hypothetical protein
LDTIVRCDGTGAVRVTGFALHTSPRKIADVGYTPTYLVGPFLTSTLDYAGFKQVVSDARAQASK